MTTAKTRFTRQYNPAGHRTVQARLPVTLARAVDPEVPDASLTDVERACRGWRQELVQDLGGEPSAAQGAIVDSVVGSILMLHTIDAFLTTVNPIDKRRRCLYRIAEQRERVADGLARRLSLLGLERRRKTVTLTEYIQQKSLEREQDAQNGGENRPEDPVPPNVPDDVVDAQNNQPGEAEGVTP